MQELAFKRHLRELAHGHHHPEEHDWGNTPIDRSGKAPPAKTELKTKKKDAGKRRTADKKKGSRHS